MSLSIDTLLHPVAFASDCGFYCNEGASCFLMNRGTGSKPACFMRAVHHSFKICSFGSTKAHLEGRWRGHVACLECLRDGMLDTKRAIDLTFYPAPSHVHPRFDVPLVHGARSSLNSYSYPFQAVFCVAKVATILAGEYSSLWCLYCPISFCLAPWASRGPASRANG